MNVAIELAKNADKEVPVAALIVKNNKIIAASHNKVLKDNDPTQHAEIVVIKEALQKLKSQYLTNCDVYVTLEPCAMCACALSITRIRAIYFATYDEKMGAIFNTVKIFNGKSGLYIPKIYDCIQENAAKEILRNFFVEIRKNKSEELPSIAKKLKQTEEHIYKIKI